MNQNHHIHRNCLRGILILSLILAAIITPAIAGEKYLYGSPDLRVAITGTNEFYPGEEATATIRVENTGLTIIKIVRSEIISRDDRPDTAKMAVVSLAPGDAPLTIKTDPQMIGDITGGESTTASFTIQFDEDARAGTYTIPVSIEYTYLSSAEQHGDDFIRYYYNKKVVHAELQVVVKPDVRILVTDIQTDSINVGTEGYITLTVRNTGSEDARSATLKIDRSGTSPLIPTDGSAFIGDFPAGSTVTRTFKVAVSTNAEPRDYPLSVYAEYKDRNGQMQTSEPRTFGVNTGGKIEFTAISPPAVVSPGQKTVIDVEYKNIGDAQVYRATARISAVDPFTSNDDTAYLGDLAPGETKIARFILNVDSGATEKIYGLDSEIRYRDALDNTQISKTMKVEVEVVPREGSIPPVLIGAILIVVIGAGYWYYRKRQ
ncbi:CARDB domain-containing protein [Methanocalculus sp.]|uniref:COG1361 S-layer family protein n=1 Tax=Methanocalculus sp. TaxID=2004547 RepID=UPI00261ACD2B|nr:CARDB domain-containing protein [Methanocalculus sp.]MDG6249846.1 CARDB domain-containing protein [Methanocalculus sp.]